MASGRGLSREPVPGPALEHAPVSASATRPGSSVPIPAPTASPTSGRSSAEMSRTVRPHSVLDALLAVCLFAAVGYRIGHTERASGADAASTWGTAAASTFTQARTRTYLATWQRAS